MPSKFFDLSPNDQQSIDLEDEDGISFMQLETAITDVTFPSSPVKSIYMINVESARARIELADGTVEVDRTSADRYKRWHRAEISEVPPSFDPLTIGIRLFNDRELGMPTCRLTVDTSTDIRFEERPSATKTNVDSMPLYVNSSEFERPLRRCLL